jgi:hypothetical protein
MNSGGADRAFAIWIRTGRWPQRAAVPRIEIKYNHWHDPADGKFTNAGSGKHDGSWGGGGFTCGGGGGFGGGGASSKESWGLPSRPAKRAKSPAQPSGKDVARPDVARPAPKPAQIVRVPARPLAVPPKPFRHVVRNGYDFQIDDTNRTREVSGNITSADRGIRSRTNQAKAGASDRRSGDDGGHYVAARFNGPTEAFNHFAQDANFNRGQYRVLEDQWAKAKTAGAKVHVDITPSYVGASQRPAAIEVVYEINGRKSEVLFSNAHQGRPHGK